MSSPTLLNNKLKVLSLYRQILKLGNEWEKHCTKQMTSFHKNIYERQFITFEQDAQDYHKGDEEIEREKEYIIDQAKSQFRSFKNLTNPEEIKSKIELAEKRLLLTLHYGIPFERPEHVNIYDNFWKGQIDPTSTDYSEFNSTTTTTTTFNESNIHSMKGLNPNYDELEPKFPTHKSLDLDEDENWK